MRAFGRDDPGATSRPLLLLGYVLFCCSGFNTTLLSIIGPGIGAPLDDATLGGIFAAQYSGQLLGPLVIFGRPLLALQTALFVTSVCALYFTASGHLPPAALCLYGLSLGTVMASTNMLVGTVVPTEKRKSYIERLNFFWPLSAACSPFIVHHFSSGHPTNAFALVSLNSFLSLAAVGALSFRFGIFGLRSQANSQSGQRRNALLVLLCVLAALSCGAESALYSWTPAFAMRFIRDSHGLELTVGAFWIGLLSGRLSGSFVFAKAQASRFTVTTCFVCSGAIALLAVSQGEASLIAGFFVAGASISSVYPSIISDGLPLRGSQFIFVCAGIGSTALPWLTGRISYTTGSLRYGQVVPACACVVLGCLYWYAQKRLHTLPTAKMQRVHGSERSD